MERAVIWAVLGASILGWLATAITSSAFSRLLPPRATSTSATSATSTNATSDTMRVLPAFALAALALSVFVFALTLPERGEIAGLRFGGGQGFGRGWLLGGVAALGGALACGAFSAHGEIARVQNEDAFGRALHVSAPLWPILASLALLSLFGRGVLLDALGGFIGGHVAASLLMASGVSHQTNANSAKVASETSTSTNSRDISTLLASGAVFAALLGTTVLLGTFRDFRNVGLPVGTWAALTLGTGIALAFVPLFGAFLQKLAPRKASQNASGRNAGAALRWIAALLLIGVVRALSSKLVDETGAVFAVALGVLAGIVATWCARESQALDAPAIVSPFGALAVLGALLGAFVMMQGVGVGLMLLGFWPAISFALADDGETTSNATTPREAATPGAWSLQLAPTLLQLGAFGTLMVLYRGVQTRFGADLRGVALSDQYALWGFLSGALVPSLLAGAQAQVSTLSRILRVLLAGIASVALPVLLTIFFGPKCALALLMGLSVGALLRPTLAAGGALSAAWAIFIGACLLQWTHRWLPLAELSKAEKSRALGFLVGAAILLWLLSELLGRKNPTAKIAEKSSKAEFVA